jgi:hypothetical protein
MTPVRQWDIPASSPPTAATLGVRIVDVYEAN